MTFGGVAHRRVRSGQQTGSHLQLVRTAEVSAFSYRLFKQSGSQLYSSEDYRAWLERHPRARNIGWKPEDLLF